MKTKPVTKMQSRLIKSMLMGVCLSTLIFSCEENSSPYYNQEWTEKSITEEQDYVAYNDIADQNTEEYNRIFENSPKNPLNEPLSTFSIDVDNASYSNVRRFLKQGQLPPKDAVRIEEMINYFNYDYESPSGEHPFTFKTEVAECPWNNSHKLVHIGIQGKKIDYDNFQPSNLVFLIDASGSMSDHNKLPLLKQGLSLLVDELRPEDRVAIVTYAGSAGLVLPSTPASDKYSILNALDRIQSGGSTAGGQGIQLAYEIAQQNLFKNGNNRVILATDGDFNVGVSSTSELVRLIEEKRKSDIYLTICGFGMGNYKDSRMEEISNAGNGNYFYIDNFSEAKKVFVKEMRANLFTIAKDVKIQVEFNPETVESYRLIGFENRMLEHQDFTDDTKDAGELGAGHTVTALYEIVPTNHKTESEIKLKYQKRSVITESEGELMTLKFRYKPIGSDYSNLISTFIKDASTEFYASSNDFKFSAAVAGFGMLLRDSKYKGNASYNSVLSWGKQGKGRDSEGYRSEFIALVEMAKEMSNLRD